MLDSPILDVGIGLVFVFLIFGLVCSAINEHITQLISLRAEKLWAGIRALLQDHDGNGLAAAIYNSQFITSLTPKLVPTTKPKEQPSKTTDEATPSPVADSGNATVLPVENSGSAASVPVENSGDAPGPPVAVPGNVVQPPASSRAQGDPWTRDKPSYIPADIFSMALIERFVGSSHPSTTADIINGIQTYSGTMSGEVRSTLTHLIEAAGGSVEGARKNIEAWYDAAMESVSGWYKQHVKWILLIVGFFVAFALNADSLMMANTLWNNKAQRSMLVAQAQQVHSAEGGTAGPTVQSFATNGLLGWASYNNPDDPLYDPTDPRHPPRTDRGWQEFAIGWLKKIVGILITAYAASLGAPFWFDILNRFMSVRSAGGPPKEQEAKGTKKRVATDIKSAPPA
jgi:hypothetical protein